MNNTTKIPSPILIDSKKLTFLVVLFLMTALSTQAQRRTIEGKILSVYKGGSRDLKNADLEMANLTGVNLREAT